MPFYHDLVTERSWAELQALPKKIEFILIGGWAVYLYTQALKSKDIDLIVEFPQLSTLAKLYALSKNERLKKYEAVKGEVQIDLYLPHYSELGIPVHILREHPRELEGFTLLHPTYLLALKLYTLSQRARTPKGEKDLFDCLALIRSGVADLQEVHILLKTYGLLRTKQTFLDLLQERREVPELDLNARHLARLKKKILAVFSSDVKIR